MLDYHVHSTFSVDCDTPMEESCRAAIAAGITEIAFTDHLDHEPADPGFGYYRPDAYFEAVAAARQRFAGKLTVLSGVEIDFNERIAPQVERFLNRHGDRYDFIIGSVHYTTSGELIFPRYFNGRILDDIFVPYLRQVRLAVETGWFDTIGHLDLPKRYAPATTHGTYDPILYRALLEPIFASLIERGVSFEINTSGMRQTPKTSMPGPAIVRWYIEAGGMLITIGTDSHVAETVGAGLPTTLAMLELCGLSTVSAFRRRQRRQVPINELRAAVSGQPVAG